MYRHSGAEHPRLQHKAWDGLTLPADHPFWQTHYPPNGWRCRCRAVPMRAKDHAARDDLHRPRGRMALAGVMGRGWIDALDAQGVKPATAEIMLRDHDLAHLLRDAKGHKLPIDWLRALPSHLGSPRAVLLDRTHADPSLLLVFDAPGAKLVLRLDYRLKKPRGALANVIGTGKMLSEEGLASIRAEIGRSLTLVDGDL